MSKDIRVYVVAQTRRRASFGEIIMNFTKTLSACVGASALAFFIAGCGDNNKPAGTESGPMAKEAVKSTGVESGPTTNDAVKEEEVLPTDLVVDDSVLYSLISDVDNLLMEGQTNAANSLFLGAMDKEEFSSLKEPLFNTMIRYFLGTGQFEPAKEQYLNALRTMPEIAEPGFDAIYGAHLNAGDEEGALEWARVLATQDIGEHLRMTADDWLINSLYRTAKYDEMIAAVANGINKYEAAKFAPIVEMHGRRAVNDGNVGVAEKLVEAIAGSDKKDATELKNAGAVLQVYADAASGAWEKVTARMPELTATLPDSQLLPAVRFTLTSAVKAGKPDMADAVAGALLEDSNASKVPQTRFACAREWAAVVFRPGSLGVAAYPERFEALMQRDLPAEQLFTVFANNFYGVLSDQDATAKTLLLGEKLLPELTDVSLNEAMRLYMLDMCFMVEDYGRALEMLEKGFSEHDEEWHKMSIAKVRAHKALVEKDYDAAVKYFREFMGSLGEDDVVDPVTSITFSHATLMGNNEKRIGDILTEAGKTDEAAKAYATADEWYAKALEGNKAGKETEDYIKEQRASLQ